MRYRILIVIFILIGMLFVIVPEQLSLGQTVVPGQLRPISSYRAGEIIIKIRDELPSLSRSMAINSSNTGSQNLNSLNAQFGVSNVERVFQAQSGGQMLQGDSPLLNVLLLNLRDDVNEKTALRAYASLEEVEYAELNHIYHIFSVPNDPFISAQYSLYSSSSQGIDAIGGWDVQTGENSIIIAVIDTGVDYRHEDLAGKVIKGYDFVNEDFDPIDDNGHGTHVAGIAGAITNNERGVAGVCQNCSILAIKVITADGSGANSWIANGIANAVNLGARVINLSLGGLDNSNTIRMAVEQAYQQGVVVIAASGNDGNGVPLYPAVLPEVIAVGATNRYGERASFSSYGNHLALVAPGEAIYSTVAGNSYDAWNGTSMASPHVAGLVGLMLSRNPSMTNVQVRDVLIGTAQDLGTPGRDPYFGYGRINVLAALTQTQDAGGNYPSPNPAPGPYPTPAPGQGVCGTGMGTVFAMVVIGLGWVNIENWKRKRRY